MGRPSSIIISDVDKALGTSMVSGPSLDLDLAVGGPKLVLSCQEQTGVILQALSLLESNFRDSAVVPGISPPEGFSWQFWAGVWVLAPGPVPSMDRDTGGACKSSALNDVATKSSGDLSPDMDIDSDDSMSEFERNIRKLLPDLQRGQESSVNRQSTGIRKSERQKKPSSRFTEEAGYLA